MAFFDLKQDVDQDGFVDDFIYFDEDNAEDFRRIISRYAARVREIRFERAVKVDQLEKITRIINASTNESVRSL